MTGVKAMAFLFPRLATLCRACFLAGWHDPPLAGQYERVTREILRQRHNVQHHGDDVKGLLRSPYCVGQAKSIFSRTEDDLTLLFLIRDDPRDEEVPR